ncbi:hypothetical protein [Streptomyces sp. NPDC006879]|uniref:hypothetical protein n=1 Tax=Streptomyces sp. NPDC006879 TaxID=3364767 RepID=UPI0036C6186A
MTGAGASSMQEPRLVTRRVRRRRVPRHVALATPLALAGLISLLVTGNALRPFERIVTLEARMGSKSDYFKDPEVQRLLLGRGIRVDIHRLGSRGNATTPLTGLDVVFPSGQPATKLIFQRQNRSVRSVRPFVSPLVLGTFRDYAETLVKAGVATAQQAQGGAPTLYYDLDMPAFMTLLDGVHDGSTHADQDRDGVPEGADTWNGIGYDNSGEHSNSGRVLVRTSNVCESNAAGTYLSLLAFVANGNSTPGTQSTDGPKPGRDAVTALAEKIKPLINLQGMWADEQADSYFSDLGESIAPVSLIYEHQFLAHQVAHHKQHDEQDAGRVLLYPSPYALTEPQLISLTDKGDRLVKLIEQDQELHDRAMELGFRVRFSGKASASERLNSYLRDNGIQIPIPNSDQTKSYEPDLSVLEQIINDVGNCPPPDTEAP